MDQAMNHTFGFQKTSIHRCYTYYQVAVIFCEAKDFGPKRDETRQNFAQTESLGPRQPSWNTVNFR